MVCNTCGWHAFISYSTWHERDFLWDSEPKSKQKKTNGRSTGTGMYPLYNNGDFPLG